MHIIIIGKGNGWKDAPLKGWTWGVNDLLLRRPLGLLFEMHGEKVIEADPLAKATQQKAAKDGVPVINQETYPLEEIIERFGSDYFANSVAYMIAYAMFVGATKIDIYGVNMALQSEYILEKGSVEFWIGMAKGSGIEVNIYGKETKLLKITARSGIIQEHLYGYGIPQKGGGEMICSKCGRDTNPTPAGRCPACNGNFTPGLVPNRKAPVVGKKEKKKKKGK